MDTFTKDLIQVVLWILTSAGVLVAAFKGIFEIRRSIEQRREETKQKEDELTQREKEFRWKQAEKAKDVLDEINLDIKSHSACQMLDWSGREYKITENLSERISTDEMLSAMRIDNLVFEPKEGFIRDCFETLFDKIELVSHYISIGLIDFNDVQVQLGYYVNLMAKNKNPFFAFLEFYNYTGTIAFFSEFSQWKNAPTMR